MLNWIAENPARSMFLIFVVITAVWQAGEIALEKRKAARAAFKSREETPKEGFRTREGSEHDLCTRPDR